MDRFTLALVLFFVVGVWVGWETRKHYEGDRDDD